MAELALRIECIVSHPFEENSFVAHVEGRSDCLVFDPGLEPAEITDYLDRYRLEPAAIVLTHGHADHIAGNTYLKERWPQCPIVIGQADAPKLVDPMENLSALFGLALVSPAADVLVREGDVYEGAGLRLEVLDTPGHSIGHVVYVLKQVQPWVVFGGDVLFQGSIGRTDFPDGSFEQLAEVIHGKLFTMPDDTRVLPGHGPQTTTGAEKRSNPFVGRPAGYRG